jgi:hypothetical protein
MHPTPFPDPLTELGGNPETWGWKGSGSVTHREWSGYYDVFPVLVAEFHARDVKFNMIINSAGGGGRSDAAFSRRTLRYLAELQERALNPDRYTIQSWYDHPGRNAPESDSSTMTGLTRAVLERLER